MTPKEYKKAIRVVGTEACLTGMLLQVAGARPEMLLADLPGHLADGGTLETYFNPCEEDAMAFSKTSPFYLSIKKESERFEVTVGVCFGGECGEGAEYHFDRTFRLLAEQPVSHWIH